jgi:alpha-1,6-mannosyltransferase
MIKAETMRVAPAGEDAGEDRTVARGAAMVAVVVIGIALAWSYHWSGYLHRFTQGISLYIGVYIVQFTLYLVACYAVLRTARYRSKRATLALVGAVIAFSAVFHVQLAVQPPYLSTDAYRYIWDGRVQAHGINPFRYIPDAAELAPLRDDKIFPNINRADYAPTPYPPAAQMIYLAVYLICPLSVTAFKLAVSLFDMVTILAVVAVLLKFRMDPARAIIFAWHPLLMWEGAHSGHVDPAFIACLALAMLAWTYRKPTLTGVALASATLIKLYPMMLLPVFLLDPADLQGGREPEVHRSWSLSSTAARIRAVVFNRGSLRTIAAFITVIILCYLPYMTVGSGVFGYLTGYFEEEGFVDSGGRYFPLALIRKLIPLPTTAYTVAAALVLGAVALWWLVRQKRDARDIAIGALALIGSYLLLTTPRYPWYYCWIVPFLCFVPRAGWLYMSGATVLLYTLWFIPNQYPNLPLWLGAAMYIPTVALLVWERFVRPESSQTETAVEA